MLAFYLSFANSEEESSIIEFLYKEYSQLMYKTAFSILHNKCDSEDAVQEAFLRIIKNISKFKSYSCKENVSYIVIIVRGISIDILRKQRKYFGLEDDLPDIHSTEETAEIEIEYEKVMKNIEQLPPVQRNVATLHFTLH